MSSTVAYTRVSTERQTEGSGIAQQTASICAWAAATGVVIDDWASDDETGMSAEREEIQRLLVQARSGKLKTLIIDRLDRLGRKLVVIESLYEDFTKAGTQVLCVQHALDNSPSGSMLRQIMGCVAQYQRAELLARMRSCKRQTVARKGTYGGGRDAYGYRSVGGGILELDPRTADLVRRAFKYRDAGMSLTGIAAALDNDGFRTMKGTRLHPQQVSRILAREDVYRGKKPVQNVQLEPGVTAQQPKVI